MWNREMVQLLILRYKEHEHLYNIRSPLYIDRVKRSKSLHSICQELRTINKNVTIADIKKKIHTIRAQYIKEARAIAKSKKSGDADNVYVPKLWFFSQLKFLQPHCITRKSELNISEADESDSSFVVDMDPLEYAEEPLHKKRANEMNNSCVIDMDTSEKISRPSAKRERDYSVDERIEHIKKLIAKKSEQRNCFDWLGKQVVCQISKIQNEQTQQDAIWDIQRILRRAIVKDQDERLYRNE